MRLLQRSPRATTTAMQHAAKQGSCSAAGVKAPAPAAAVAPALVGGAGWGRQIAGAARLQQRATVVTRVAAPEPAGATQQQRQQQVDFTFACPICYSTEFVVPAADPYRSCGCGRCGRTFAAAPGAYLDLTLTSGGVGAGVYQQKAWQGTELFRQPLISFIYERGWRQNFAGAGFPGPDAEYEAAMRYLAPAAGGTLVDASCGTGLFTRLFARSGAFKRVVALDFSESMLRQAQQYFADDPSLKTSTPIAAVRADVARLPFATGSVDAIHAGAAIHCWPNPQAAMAEISRVLRPGGVFVATTFLTPLAPLGEIVGDDTIRPFSQAFNPFGSNSKTFRYWEERELQDLCDSVGLQSFEADRRWLYIMLRATKPAAAAAATT